MPCVGSWKESLHLCKSQHERNSVASSICKASQWRIALLFKVDCCVSHGIQVNAEAKGGRWRCALASLHFYRALGGEVSVVSLGAATTGLAQCAAWRQALLQMALDLDLEVNVFVANAVLLACCRAQELLQGLKLWRRMRRQGPSPDVVSLNTLLSACGAQEASELFALAKSSQVEPNLLSLNLLLTAQRAAERSRWAESLQLCQCQRGDGITFNLCLAACMRGMQWQRSLSFYQTRGFKGSQELRVAHSTIGSGMIESTAWLSAFEMLEQLGNRFLEADSESYAVLGSSCMTLAKRDKENRSSWAIASQLLRASQRQLVRLNEVFLGSSIGSSSRSQQWQVAAEVFEAMRSSSLRIDVLAYNLMGSNMNWRESEKLLRRISGASLEPDQATWSSLLVSRASESLWRSCSQILELVSSSRNVDSLLQSLHLGAMNAAPWRLASSVLRLAAESSLQGDRILLSRVFSKAWPQGLALSGAETSKLCNALLAARLERSGWRGGLQLLRKVDGKGLSALLTACGGWPQMLALMQRRRAAGCEVVNSESCGALVIGVTTWRWSLQCLNFMQNLQLDVPLLALCHAAQGSGSLDLLHRAQQRACAACAAVQKGETPHVLTHFEPFLAGLVAGLKVCLSPKIQVTPPKELESFTPQVMRSAQPKAESGKKQDMRESAKRKPIT